MTLLDNSFWEIVSVVLAIIALVTTILFYVLQLKRKKLTYHKIYQSELITKKGGLGNKIQILFNNVPVDNLTINVVKISNSGNIPITSNDFEENLFIEIEGASTILSAEVIQTNPSKLNTAIEIEGSRLVIQPILLNPNDFFIVKLLSNGIVKNLLVDARVIGVERIEVESDPRKLVFTNMLVFEIISFLIFYFILFKFKEPSPVRIDTFEIISFSVVISIQLLAIKIFYGKLDNPENLYEDS